MCLTGSRLCFGGESRYSPIEGEALAVARALKKAKLFVMGCMNLHILVDCKPLLGIFSPDKALADIENSRLRNLAVKVSEYVCTTVHGKGVENTISDMMSRHPVEGGLHITVRCTISEKKKVLKIGLNFKSIIRG